MKKILVPMDFSTEAMYALEVAKEIAENYTSSEIILLNVIGAPSHSTFSAAGEYVAVTMDDLYVLKLIEKVKIEMDEIISDQRFEDLNIRERVRVGNQFNSVAEEICSVPADLIILGTKGRNGIEEILWESTAEKVVRYANCPVITIKSKPDNFSIKNIVFACSFKEEIPAIKKLKELQSLFSATLHLLFVKNKNNKLSGERVKERMELFADRANLTDYTINVYDSSSTERGINEFAKHINADLIAMATHARKGFLHMIMGSLTENLVNHTEKIMLTFHMNEENRA